MTSSSTSREANATFTTTQPESPSSYASRMTSLPTSKETIQLSLSSSNESSSHPPLNSSFSLIASLQPKATDVVLSETVISYGTQNTTQRSSQTTLLVNTSSSLRGTSFAFLSSTQEGMSSSSSVVRTSGMISTPDLSASGSVQLNASKPVSTISSAIQLSLSSSNESSSHPSSFSLTVSSVTTRSQATAKQVYSRSSSVTMNVSTAGYSSGISLNTSIIIQNRSLSLNQSSLVLPLTTSVGHSAISMTMSPVVSTLNFTASALLPSPSTFNRTSSGGLSTATIKYSSSLSLSLVMSSTLTSNVTLVASLSPSLLRIESTDLVIVSSVTKSFSLSSNPTAEISKSIHPNLTTFPNSTLTSFSVTSVYQVTTTQNASVALSAIKGTPISSISKLIPSAFSSLPGLQTSEGSSRNVTTLTTKPLRTIVPSIISPAVTSSSHSKVTRTVTNISGSVTRYQSISTTPSVSMNLTLSSTFARDRMTSLLRVSSSKSILDVPSTLAVSRLFGSRSTLTVSTLQYFSPGFASSRPFLSQSLNSTASLVLPNTTTALQIKSTIKTSGLSSVLRRPTTTPMVTVDSLVNSNVSLTTTTTTSVSTSFVSVISLSSGALFSSSSVTIFLRTSTLTDTLAVSSSSLKDTKTYQSSLATILPSMLKSATSPFAISSLFTRGSSAGSLFVATESVGSSLSTRALFGTIGYSSVSIYLSSSSIRGQQSLSTEASRILLSTSILKDSRSSVLPSSKRVTSITGSAYSVERRSKMMVTTSSSVVAMETSPLPSRSSISDKSSSYFERSQVSLTIVRISSLSGSRPFTGLISSPRSSDKVMIKSSPVTITFAQSTQPKSTSVGTRSLVTKSEVRVATLDHSEDVTKPPVTGSFESTSGSVSRHLVISTTTSSFSTFAKNATTKSPDKSSTFTSSSPSVVLPTVDPDSDEGIVGIQILVPTNENEMNDSFRETLELNLAAAYRWGLEKGDSRKRRDLGWIVKDVWAQDPRIMARNDSQSWKRSGAYKVHERQSRRFRRQSDNIAAVVTTIRRALPTVGEETVDVYYRMFDGLTMLSAENIVKTVNRLSEGELVVAVKYGITLRPYVFKEVQVTPVPKSAGGGTSKLSVLIPAIIVPLVVVLFLILALLWIKCIAKRKRERLKVNPEKRPPYKNLEVRTLPTNDFVLPKKPGNVYAAPGRSRASISSTSSKSSSDVPTKSPAPPPPEYTLTPGQTTKPHRQYRRRRAAEYNGETTHRDKGKRRGKVEHEKPAQMASNVTENIEMKHLAGVVENRPQMKEEKLARIHRPDELSVRFATLPPLVATPLVGPRPSSSMQRVEENKQREKIISESGVPQANVERWRNKMCHREKLRQEIREKEREKDSKVKKLKEEEDGEILEDPTADSLERSLTAERKRRSRLDRWRHNRVGTSSSKTSSSDSISRSSSSESDLDKRHKKKKERKEKKGKGRKDRVKDPNKLPRLVSGTGAKAASMEMAWTVKETPGVRLLAVRPHEENTESWQPAVPEPVYAQNRMPGREAPQHRPTSSRSQRNDRIHYLLETGFPVVPVMSTPLMHPTTDQYFENDGLYEDMEEVDPNVPRYDEAVVTEDEPTTRGFPNRPKEAFGGPALYDDDHIYDEPIFTPVSLPQTALVYPEHNQPRYRVPSRGYGGMPPKARGRPTSAARRPESARPVRSARPSSARTNPLAQYEPSAGIHSQYDRNAEPTSVPNPRYIFSNRPTVGTAHQPSIGTSPRYMVAPEGREQPRSFFDDSRAILSRPQPNVNHFQRDSRDRTFTPSTVQARNTTGSEPAVRLTKKQAPSTNSRLELVAMERAELEAQLLVSRALARARKNVRT